jgi:hypothetical protein
VGLRFVRRRTGFGFDYFLTNPSERAVDRWVGLSVPFASAVILDPRSGEKSGVAASRHGSIGASEGQRVGASGGEVYLQMQPGESCIVRVYTNNEIKAPAWPYVRETGKAQEVTGEWKLKFLEGGPELPADRVISKLGSWTDSADADPKRFAGTARYSLEFERPGNVADDWSLDLGKVCDSARVRINGHEIPGFWCAPFKATIGKWLRPGKNLLEVEVTNVAANRVADLDRRKVRWKYFYDINMASKRYRSFDAAEWPVRESGLLGPVTLTPMTVFRPK